MAEAIARYDAADVIEPSSAGLSPMGSIAEQTKQTLMLNGYSANGLTSDALTREAADVADIIINMTAGKGKKPSGNRRKSKTGWCRILSVLRRDVSAGVRGIKRRVNQLALGLREQRENKTRAK